MTVVGYKTPTEKEFGCNYTVTEQSLPQYLSKVLTGPGIDYIRAWLRDFLDWLKTENEYEIRGASLLIVLDDSCGIHRIKLIDLGSFEKLPPGQRDTGLITGVSNLL